MALTSNMRGALLMLAGTFAFTAVDALTKLVGATINPAQLMIVRGIFATILILPLAWRHQALGKFARALAPRVALRVLCEVLATIFYLLALLHLPLANISAIMQSLPLAVTMGAALFLKEPVGLRRWCAIIVGFTGVMILVRPGVEGFSLYSLLALYSVGFAVLRDLLTKGIAREVPSILISWVTAVAVTIAGVLLLKPMGGWQPLNVSNAGLLALAALFLVVGYQCTIEATRQGAISFIAPFRYTGMLWAVLFGYLIFSDLPGWPILAGAAIVITSGVYTLYRERVVSKILPDAQSMAQRAAIDPFKK